MMKLNKMLKMVMVLVVTLVSFSGAALTAQAAGPGGWHNDQRWEQRDNRGDRNWRNDRRPEPPKKKIHGQRQESRYRHWRGSRGGSHRPFEVSHDKEYVR